MAAEAGKVYRTFKRTCTNFREFAKARKLEDMRNLTYEEAYRRCQRLNSELTKRQIKKGTRFEFEHQ